jgi:beta-lactam-binding protein with PASTA domain
VIAVVVVLGVAGGVVGALSDSSSDVGGDAAEPTGPTITGSTGTTAPTPSAAIVPDVAGEQISSARADLKDAALTASIEKRYSGEPKGLVLAQTPSNGTTVDPGTTVELVVAQPLPRIPNVTTKNQTQAKRILKNAGFRVAVKKQNSTTQRDGDIVSQSPSGGTQARPDRLVTIVVINNTCTPGYSPCIPQGPDVDCLGGEGDGPRYVGTVRVTGSDPYDLDDDNDSVGCE